MEHALNVNVAVEFDVDSALFLQNLKFWTLKNLANKKHIHDGYCWSYNTLEAFEDIFPYWSRRQIERVISNCIKSGLIVKGNYNATAYDRTMWYAMTPLAFKYYPELLAQKYINLLIDSISPNGEMEFPEWGNRNPQTGTPIPDTDPDTKSYILPDSLISEQDHTNDERFLRFYNSYPRKESPRDAYKAFKEVIGDDEGLLDKVLADVKYRAQHHPQWKNKKYIKYPATYLRSGDWESERPMPTKIDLEEQMHRRQEFNAPRKKQPVSLKSLLSSTIRQNGV